MNISLAQLRADIAGHYLALTPDGSQTDVPTETLLALIELAEAMHEFFESAPSLHLPATEQALARFDFKATP